LPGYLQGHCSAACGCCSLQKTKKFGPPPIAGFAARQVLVRSH
jgi:hypothetical protein